MSDRYSKMFAEYAASTTPDSVPQETAHEVKRRILDSIGVAVAAFVDDAPKAAREYAYDQTNPNGATLWGLPVKVTPEAAALANGVATRYLDFNDTYLSLEPLHPSDMIPGLMALCEWSGRPIAELIAGIAVGYEVAVNLCDAASIRAHRWDHVIYTGIGAACGAGRLLGLTADQIEHAISIAAIPHAPMRQTRAGELSMWKGAAAANAVRNGVFAALMARKGFTGPYQPFTGEMGFIRQMLEGQPFIDSAFASVEQSKPPTRILDTYIKKYAVEYHAQSAVDAVLELRQELGGKPELIDAIRVDTFKASYEIIAKDPEKWDPKTRETADHSLQYIAAQGLHDGWVNKHSFSPEKLRDQGVRGLLAKLKLEEDDELTKGYPDGIPNRVTVTTTDGRSLSKEVRYPRGHAKNPMTDDEVVAKFRDNVGLHYKADQPERVAEMVLGIESLPNLDVLLQEMHV